MKQIAFLFFIVLICQPGISQNQETEPDIYGHICINEREYELVQRINQYRMENALDPIPVSASLCYVAQTHVKDLFLHRPHRGKCSLHSWSEKGRWKPCCYKNSAENGNCMYEKPSELTDYESQAYEVVYYENKPAAVSVVMDFWKSDYRTQSILLNQGGWENFHWKAIGVGIFENYASVWFGESPEQDREVTHCENGKSLVEKSEITQDQTKSRYYLIIYSFKRREDATRKLKALRKQGDTNVRLLVKENNYRIALDSFTNMKEAESMRKKLKKKYPDAWVLKK